MRASRRELEPVLVLVLPLAPDLTPPNHPRHSRPQRLQRGVPARRWIDVPFRLQQSMPNYSASMAALGRLWQVPFDAGPSTVQSRT